MLLNINMTSCIYLKWYLQYSYSSSYCIKCKRQTLGISAKHMVSTSYGIKLKRELQLLGNV